MPRYTWNSPLPAPALDPKKRGRYYGYPYWYRNDTLPQVILLALNDIEYSNFYQIPQSSLKILRNIANLKLFLLTTKYSNER